MADFSKTFLDLIPPLEGHKAPPAAAADAAAVVEDPNLRRSMRCTKPEESMFWYFKEKQFLTQDSSKIHCNWWGEHSWV